MIQSLFIVGADTGDLVMEKHWREKTTRSCLDAFWEEVAKHPLRQDVPPVITLSKYYIVSILRSGLFFVAVVAGETPSLAVVELLIRIVDTFEHYFGNVGVKTIGKNFSTVYQLLEEMIDNGYPLITEPNALRTMIRPPTLGSKFSAFVTGKSNVTETIGDSAMSVVPWRKTDVKYANNEIFFDILEDIDCIIEPNGAMTAQSVRGVIDCKCQLTGTPDLTMFLHDPSILNNASFHPCVRISRFEREKVLSFIPPDGRFRLATYRAPDQSVSAPIYCRPEINQQDATGARVRFTVGRKPMPSRTSSASTYALGSSLSSPADQPVEEVALMVQFPSAVKGVDISSENVGKVLYDSATNTLTWTIGKMPKDGIPSIAGKITYEPGRKHPPMERMSARLHFVAPNTNASGLGVADVKMVSEVYKFQSAARAALRAGCFQLRC